MIYVIGDSHTRTFANNANFFPLFVGPGKEICFISDEHLDRVKARISDIVSHLKAGSIIMFVLGEPDTRYYLGKGWTPWASELSIDIDKPYELLEKSLNRYKNFVTWFSSQFSFKLIMFNIVASPREQQNVYIRYMNQNLKKICSDKGITFIDIQNKIMEGDVVKAEYMADVVHLSAKVQPLIEAEMKLLGLVIEDTGSLIEAQQEESRSAFVYSHKFSCFTYQPKKTRIEIKYQRIMRFLRSILRGMKGV